MRIVIGGAGEVGRGVAKALRSEGRDVVVIDTDPYAIKEAQALDVLVVQGDVTRRKDMQEARINRATIFIAATEKDEVNLISCSLAKDLANGSGSELVTIARVHDSRLLDTDDKETESSGWSGVDFAVCPDSLVMVDLMAGLNASAMHEVLSLSNDTWVAVIQVASSADSMIHKTLSEIDDGVDGLPRIFAIKRQNEPSFVPSAETAVLPADLLAFATIGEHSFRRIMQAAGHEPHEYDETPRVIIFGASRIARSLAKEYLNQKCRVTIVSPNLESANDMAASDIGANSDLDVIHGDPLDTDLLAEVDISDHDIAISVLDDDHTNMAVSMHAAEIGVERTGLVLDDSQLAKVARRIGQSFAVSRRRVAVNSIMREVHNRVPGNFHLLNSIPEMVAMTATVGENSKMCDKPVSDLEAGSFCRVAFITRTVADSADSVLRASAEKVLRAGDRITLFVATGNIKTIEDRLL